MTTTSDYLLLFRGTEWQKGLSPQEMEETLGRFMAWFEQLTTEGKVKGANPLVHEGRFISGPMGRTVVDGPFAESKEAVAGYFLVTASDMDEAMDIARQCPTLVYGASIEVRPVAAECPMLAAMRESAEELVHA